MVIVEFLTSGSVATTLSSDPIAFNPVPYAVLVATESPNL